MTTIDAHNYVVGEEITMKLMKRTRGSTITLPSMQWSVDLSEKPSNVDGRCRVPASGFCDNFGALYCTVT